MVVVICYIVLATIIVIVIVIIIVIVIVITIVTVIDNIFSTTQFVKDSPRNKIIQQTMTFILSAEYVIVLIRVFGTIPSWWFSCKRI